MPIPQIEVVMVYDKTARKLFSWQKRAWSKTPVTVTRYSGFNIGVKTTNPGTITVTLGFMIYEGGTFIAQQVGEVQPSKPFDFTSEQQMQASSRNFTVKLLFAAPASVGGYAGIADTMSFTVEPVEQKKEEPPPEAPPVAKTCLLTAVGLAPLLLNFIRNVVRPLLPMPLTVGYYKLSFWMLNRG